jgi:hypothetical protein
MLQSGKQPGGTWTYAAVDPRKLLNLLDRMYRTHSRHPTEADLAAKRLRDKDSLIRVLNSPAFRR